MINTCNYSDNWQPYISDYDKFEYDIKLKDGTVVENCYPNGGIFNSISDEHNGQRFKEQDVSEIRFSARPRFGINGRVSSVPQHRDLDIQEVSYPFHNPYKFSYPVKEKTCKGRHEYRLVDTINEQHENGTIKKEIWACQCGKVLGL